MKGKTSSTTLTLTGINPRLSKETLTKMGVDFTAIDFPITVEHQNGMVRFSNSAKWHSTLFFTFKGDEYRDV